MESTAPPSRRRGIVAGGIEMRAERVLPLILAVGVLAVAAAGCFGPLGASSAESAVRWEPELAQARKRARAENKRLFIQFTGAGCRSSAQMDRLTFQDAEVATRVNRDYVPVKLDAAEHRDLFADYGGRYVPMSVWATAEGDKIHAYTGFRTAADLLAEFPSLDDEEEDDADADAEDDGAATGG